MKKVLLIEDDLILRENTTELLELSNYKVITAPNGKLGITTAISNVPDIIICDILMPELNGYGVLETLAKNNITKHIPFIFLSAKTERKDIRFGMNLGADDYITKPFDEEELISTIRSRIAKASILKDEREKPQSNVDDDLNQLRSLSDLKNFLVDNGTVFNYKKSDTIYKKGHNSNFIYLIIKGAVKCYKLNVQGKELTTSIYKEDDLFGYTSFTKNMSYQETCTAIKDVELAAISKNEFNDILHKNNNVTLELVQLLTDNLTGVKDQLMQMAYSSVNKKTAITLLKFANKLNRNPKEPLIISRSDLASVAGIATETLIRTMSDFKKQGLIEIEDRNIKILDVEKLQNIY